MTTASPDGADGERQVRRWHRLLVSEYLLDVRPVQRHKDDDDGRIDRLKS